MICSLEDFSSLPEGTQVPVCIFEGKIQYDTPGSVMCSNVQLFTDSVSNIPNIFISNELLHPTIREVSSRVFLPASQSVWKHLQDTWYEKGFLAMLEAATQQNENEKFIGLEFLAKHTLSVIKSFSRLQRFIPGYSKVESGEVLVPKISQNCHYNSSNIRCLAWHRHCSKLAVAARDDSVRIYSDKSQLVPLLKCRSQYLISCMAWRPLCTSELAVACADGVIVWQIDPNSVITRPSASSSTILLSRPNHKHVSSITWSPLGDLLVSGSASSKTMYVWSVDVDEAVPLTKLKGGGISFVSWSPDSSKLFSATTNLVFRVWDTCWWEPERWTLGAGRVVSAAWSPCSSLVLFAVTLQPTIFCLDCGSVGSVFLTEDTRAAKPLIDLTPVELTSGERVGGEVSCLVWDKKGRYLAVTFRNCDVIAVFSTTFFSTTLNVSPCCFIRGILNESPSVIAFQENFTEGANLTIGWSSGRVQYFPIIYTDLNSVEANLSSYNVPNLSGMNSMSSFLDYSTH